jgi:DNA-binding HxlR family transcriptional regulator
VPAPVMYPLTAYGETALPVVEGVRLWGTVHLQRSGVAEGDPTTGCVDAVA